MLARSIWRSRRSCSPASSVDDGEPLFVPGGAGPARLKMPELMITTLTERASGPVTPRWGRGLGHPAGVALTAAILLAAFGWSFVIHPDRVAPTKDPAYYTWRTEALMSETPERLLEVKGAFDMFSGGYRVAAPVIGGMLRRVAGVHTLKTTVFLMVALPVLVAVLLGAFAYRQRRDPLMFHSVALLSGSLFLTPPFVGYLDNMLCLLFLAAALSLLPETRTLWPARVGFALLLLMAGFTHPTTLVIFCVTLGLLAGWRLVWSRFDLRNTVRSDAPMLVTAFVAALITYALWKVGIWGEPASLTEAALPPPYGSDFFVDRLVLWVKAFRPALNGPLFALGLAAVVAAVARRRTLSDVVDPHTAEYDKSRAPAVGGDDLVRVSLLWLAPLAGIFGFLAGLTYPYYRFFNTTLAWVLLAGMGAYFLAAFFMSLAAAGRRLLAVAGIAALGVLIGTNFTNGYRISGWNNPSGGWLEAQTRADLDALRAALESDNGSRPVVFVIDQDDRDFQVWGFTKLSGNTSRYGMPQGRVDDAYLYLGSLDGYLAHEPTLVGDETYDRLSRALLADVDENVGDEEPVVVVARAFNETGFNADSVFGDGPIRVEGDLNDVWFVSNGEVVSGGEAVGAGTPDDDSPGPVHLVLVLGGLVVLMVPGVLALHFFLPDAGPAEAVGLVPAISLALLTVVAVAVLAIARAPLSPALAWATVGISVVAGGAMRAAAGRASTGRGERIMPAP